MTGVETGRAVKAVAVVHGERGEPEGGGGFGEVFGIGSAAEEVEGAAGVEFGVHILLLELTLELELSGGPPRGV